jgi:mono/diheme cytochrome c family protein
MPEAFPMRRCKSLFIIALLAVVVLGVYFYSGAYNVGADVPHTRVVHWLLSTVRERSVAANAAGIQVPKLDDPAKIAAGAADYAEMCSSCHLAPGMDMTEISRGLNPRPPELRRKSSLTPTEQFWVIKHGIRTSGMAAWGRTHDDARIWDMVAFLRKLPSLSPEEYRALTERTESDDRHGGHAAHGADHDHGS